MAHLREGGPACANVVFRVIRSSHAIDVVFRHHSPDSCGQLMEPTRAGVEDMARIPFTRRTHELAYPARHPPVGHPSPATDAPGRCPDSVLAPRGLASKRCGAAPTRLLTTPGFALFCYPAESPPYNPVHGSEGQYGCPYRHLIRHHPHRFRREYERAGAASVAEAEEPRQRSRLCCPACNAVLAVRLPCLLIPPGGRPLDSGSLATPPASLKSIYVECRRCRGFQATGRDVSA